MWSLLPPSTSLCYFPCGIPQVFLAFTYRVSLFTVTARDAQFDTTILTTAAEDCQRTRL